MSRRWYRFGKRMEDRESWLTALLEKEPGGAEEARRLCATAALLRAALNAADVPESVQSQSRARGLALLEEKFGAGPEESQRLPTSRLSRFGSWLQVAFNLFRRR